MEPGEESTSFIDDCGTSMESVPRTEINVRRQKTSSHAAKDASAIMSQNNGGYLLRQTLLLVALAFLCQIPAGLAQSIPIVSECAAGTAPVFLFQHNSTNGQLLRSAPTANFLDCADLCGKANVRKPRDATVADELFIATKSNPNNAKNARKSPKSPENAQKVEKSQKNRSEYSNNSTTVHGNVLSQLFGVASKGEEEDCELFEAFDAQFQRDLQDCVGVDYADGQCRIIGAAATRYQSPASSTGGASLITKSCVQSKGICASPFHFDVHEQKILVGFAREVVPADSIEVCLTACLDAFDKFGFECESLMYYPVDQECILNTEDRLDRPDLFVDEHESTVIYLDNNCAGSQCYAPYVTQYVSVEGRQLKEELDHSFSDIDAASCEELCTQRLTTTINDFNCKSFMYNNVTRTCILSDERSKPLGRANLTEAKGFNYFEKKCFASPRTCRNVPSFTRVPQMLLVGFAAFVMENVPSVTMCLDQCTNPPPETGDKFVCKSAMYYYNEQECILNAESRHTKPDLFIREEDDFLVDYFDINCRLEAEKCPAGKSLYTVKTLNAALPEGDGSLHVIEATTANVAECTSKCFNLAPEKCRSFNYDKSSGLCNLLYLDGKTTLRPQPKTGVDLYDMHCLQSPTSATPCLNTNGTLYSRYLYTKLPGLPTKEYEQTALSKCLDICSTSERCEGVNYNRRNGNCAVFARVEPSKDSGAIGEKHDHIDFYTNLCVVKEFDVGLSSAANIPKELIVVPSASRNDTRDAALKSSFSKIKPTIREPENRFKPTADAAVNSKSEGASLRVFNTGNVEPVMIPAEAVKTICNYEGIKVQVGICGIIEKMDIKHDQKFTGVVFVKNKYESCRAEVQDSDSATLVLGLPPNFGMKPILLDGSHGGGAHGHEDANATKSAADGASTGAPLSGNELRRHRRQTDRDCGIVDMDNGSYKTTVVVQTNNLGIPGLVTSMDQIYEISCNYSSMLGGKVIAAANMTVHGPQPSLIQPRGKIELGNPVLMQMKSTGDGNSHPIIQNGKYTVDFKAKLGDILELRWEIVAMDDELDFFVKDCYAEPGNSASNAADIGATSVPRGSERLQLIAGGCPTLSVSQKLIREPIQQQGSAVKIAHLQAFRFDSSSTVRITCHLEICKESCAPATCDLASGPGQKSWGRKKRAADTSRNSVLTEFETKRYKVPRFSQATTSLIIVDPLQQMSESSTAAVYLARQSSQDFSAAPLKTHQKHDAKSEKPVEKSFLPSAAPQIDAAGVEGEMCMNKWTLLAVLGTLFALILVQAVIVTKYIFQRWFFSAEARLAAAKAAGDSMPY